jgi:hypothetical protein
VIQHLPACLIIVGTLAIWAFYAMFAWPALSWQSTPCLNCSTAC